MTERLVEVTRGELIESAHNGSVAVVDVKGRLLYRAGDPEMVTYMRSCAKPLQAVNVILSGAAKSFGLTPPELAIISSSHYGEPLHLTTVEGILKKLGLTEAAFLSGISSLLSRRREMELAWQNIKPTPIYNDCSGKHSGMLAVCLHKNYPTKNYTDPKHPCQIEAKRIIAEITGYPEEKIMIGVDGCSVSVFGLPLRQMAYAYARLANPEGLNSAYKDAAKRIYTSVTSNPFLIAGTGGLCTELMKHTNGRLIGKIGAEGVYCVGVKDEKIGIAVKVESGSMAVLPPIVFSALDQLGLLTKEEKRAMAHLVELPNLNDKGNVVGKIRAMFKLQKGGGK